MRIERKTWWRYGIFLVSIIVTFIILLTSIVNKKYDLKVGDIAPVDFRANVDLVDEVTTKALIEDAVASVQNQYTQELEDLKSTHSTQLGNLTHDKEVVEIELKHTKERLLKEQKDTQELEAILKEYMEANILTVWFNRRFKRLPELPLKPTEEDKGKE